MGRRLTISKRAIEWRVEVNHQASITRSAIANCRMTTDTCDPRMRLCTGLDWQMRRRMTAHTLPTAFVAPSFFYMRQKPTKYGRFSGLTMSRARKTLAL